METMGTLSRCPICLEDLLPDHVAQLDSCQHCFCYPCIHYWSEKHNTCPMDRQSFKQIYRPGLPAIEVRDTPSSSSVQEEEMEYMREVAQEVDDYYASIVCETCQDGENEEILLLCDGCNLGYHTYCLHPALASIPPGNWYCPVCTEILAGIAG